MNQVCDFNYSLNINTNLENILEWKLKFSKSKIKFIEINDELITFLVTISVNEKYVFDYNIINKSINNNIGMDEDSIELENFMNEYQRHPSDLIPVELSEIPTDNIITVLDYFDNFIEEYKTRHTISLDSDSDEELVDIDNNSEHMLLYSIKHEISKLQISHPRLKISHSYDCPHFNITVDVSKTEYIFTLIIDLIISSNDIDIDFGKVKPNNVFMFLFRKHKFFNSGCADIDFNNLILTIISFFHENDISTQEDNDSDEINIDNLVIQLYTFLNIQLDDYMWRGPTSICSTEDSPFDIMICNNLDEIYMLFLSNEQCITMNHFYKMYPIMMYYFKIIQINVILFKQQQYEIITNIVSLLLKSFDFDFGNNVKEIITTFLEDNVVETDSKILLENIIDAIEK